MNLARNTVRARPFPGLGAAVRLLPPLTLALLAASGCGAEPRHESVSGAVTSNGQPLQDGSIQFTPDGGEGLAVGSIVHDGRYALPNPPGLPAGEYRVSVAATGSPAASPDTAPDLDLPKAVVDSKKRAPAPQKAQPAFRATVTAGGSNTFDFELSDKDHASTTKAASR